jgi:hypothetical protein
VIVSDIGDCCPRRQGKRGIENVVASYLNILVIVFVRFLRF